MILRYQLAWVYVLMIPFLLSACDSSSRSSAVLNPQQINQQTQLILNNEDRVSVVELSDWIIRDTRDFDVIDIRETKDYEASHIRNALHRNISQLLTEQGLEQLAAHKKQVIYSTTGQRSAQVAALLRLSGINAYSLDGGYQQWLGYTTDPGSENTTEQDAHARARQQAVACYFEGEYVAAAGLAVKQLKAGFTPPLTAVQPVESVEEVADPLGLGLGLGDEEDTELEAEETESTGLVLGEGC